jgi:hypothetical protein
MTLLSVMFSGAGTSMDAAEPAWASASPSANDAPTTGMDATNGASVPTMTPSRAGVLP